LSSCGIQQYFYWDGLPADIAVFIRSCLHCLRCRGGHVIPRPLGQHVRPTRPNQWLSFDYLYVSAADETAEGYTHILTVVDMFSKYVMLTPTKAADTASAANFNALLKWFAAVRQLRRRHQLPQ
jgi:hypothetical protein